MNNDLENIPLGLIVSLASLFALLFFKSSSVGAPFVAHNIFVIFFGLFRFGHTVAYHNRILILRSICFSLGLLCVVGIGINGLVSLG